MDNAAQCVGSTNQAWCIKDRQVNKVRLEVYLLNLSYFVYVEKATINVSVHAAGQHTHSHRYGR